MSRRAVIGAAVGLTFAGSVVLAACSPTTYDSSLATTTSAAATTSTLPSGTAAELLPVMLADVRSLPEKVSANRGEGETATEIEQLWAAIKPEITATRPELVPDFEFVVRRCRDAADRRRPADADRALKNLEVLVTNYLG